jgi:hypothetical protein
MSGAEAVIGVDLGGTNVRAGRVEGNTITAKASPASAYRSLLTLKREFYLPWRTSHPGGKCASGKANNYLLWVQRIHGICL